MAEGKIFHPPPHPAVSAAPKGVLFAFGQNGPNRTLNAAQLVCDDEGSKVVLHGCIRESGENWLVVFTKIKSSYIGTVLRLKWTTNDGREVKARLGVVVRRRGPDGPEAAGKDAKPKDGFRGAPDIVYPQKDALIPKDVFIAWGTVNPPTTTYAEVLGFTHGGPTLTVTDDGGWALRYTNLSGANPKSLEVTMNLEKTTRTGLQIVDAVGVELGDDVDEW